MDNKFSVQRVVAILRVAGVQIQDARGSRRAQRAGLKVSQWQGSEYRGAPVVLVSLIKLDMAPARQWFDSALAAQVGSRGQGSTSRTGQRLSTAWS